MAGQRSFRIGSRAVLLGAGLAVGLYLTRSRDPAPPPQSQAFVEVSVPDQAAPAPLIEAAALTARWPALGALTETQQGDVTAALNGTPASCPACADDQRSLARCALEPPPGCENVPLLVARAARGSRAGASPGALVSLLSYPDVWVAEAATGDAGAVPVELWVDPASPLLGPTLEVLDALAASGAPMALRLRLAADGRWPDEEALQLASLAAQAQGQLEPWLRALARARAAASAAPDGSTPASSPDISRSLEALLSDVIADPALSGLDQARWQAARAAAETAALRAASLAEAQGARGVRATPTWFVGGYRLRGMQSPDALNRVLAREAADLAAGSDPWAL